MLKKTSGLLFFTAAFVAAVVIYHNPPGNNHYYPPCFFKKCLGFDCPGCGSTRACYQLLHGHIAQAADHNIMLLFFIPVMFIGIVNAFTARMQVAWQFFNKPMIVLWLVIIFWLLRNIPVLPFTWMHSDK